MSLVYIIFTVIAGLALDWGLIERLKVIVGAFGDNDEIRYRDLPRWRLFLIVVASFVVGWSVGYDEPFPLWAGGLFVLANVCGVCTAIGHRS